MGVCDRGRSRTLHRSHPPAQLCHVRIDAVVIFQVKLRKLVREWRSARI